MCVSADGKTLTARQIERLRALKLAHLRVDLPMWAQDWLARLKRAAKQAKALGAALEIGLFVSDDAEGELTAFEEARHSTSAPIARYLVFHRSENRTGERWLALARRCLGKRAVIYSGTNKFFTELNCNRPSRAMRDLVDGLCYSFNPQVHAFDHASLAESPEAQGETIRTYKAFAKGAPLAITPITLKPRWTLGDPGPEPDDRRGEFDPRQMSLFGAGWTVASLKHIAQAGGASSITIYETTGKRGVMNGRIVFPTYHIFADVAEFGGRVVASRSSDPLAVEGLVLCRGKRLRILLANLTDRPQTVTLHGLPSNSRIKLLDEASANRAMQRPEAWRADTGTPFGDRTITLPPCAIARIDA